MNIVYDRIPETKTQDFAVFPENAETVAMFLRLSSQWRGGFSGPTGLDYTAVLAVLALYEVPDKKQMLDDLRIMENAALKKILEEK